MIAGGKRERERERERKKEIERDRRPANNLHPPRLRSYYKRKLSSVLIFNNSDQSLVGRMNMHNSIF